MVGGHGGNGDLVQRTLFQQAGAPGTVVFSTPDPAAGHCQPTPPTHCPGGSWTLSGKSGSVSYGVTAASSWVLVGARVCLCPPRFIKSHWPIKVKFSRGSQSLCQIPRLGNLLWALELLQQCYDFSPVIFHV